MSYSLVACPPFPLLFAQADKAAASTLSELGAIPYVVLGVYLLVLLVLGILGWVKSKAGEEDYYLAGRGQGWLVSSLTIMATFFSSFALLGAPGMVYREGVVFALFSLNVPVAGLCVYLLGCRIWRLGKYYGYVTPGDMIAEYYGSRYSLRVLVAIACFLYAIPYVVMQIQAGAVISEGLFGEDFYTVGAILLALITMAYIMIGGMRSVAWTDLIQGVLLIAGMLIGGLAMFFIFDGPANFGQRVVSDLPDSSLTSPGNTGLWTWTMVLTVCLLGSSGSMVQPAQWMRYYAASSSRTLQRGAMIFAVVLTTCFIFGVMLIGIAGQVLYPLQFSHSQELAQPLKLDGEIPKDLQAHFSYTAPDPKKPDSRAVISWAWAGADVRPLHDNDIERLRQLNDNQAYKDNLTQLQAKVANPNLRPGVAPNEAMGGDYNSILVVVLNRELPDVLGSFGAIFASLMIIAIMAASMSTADSNLHALSAVLTRDVYDQFLNPKAKEQERVWVGRGIIVAATLLSLSIVISSHSDDGFAKKYDFLGMIAQMGLMAIAFSAQLLPVAIDILFLRKGTSRGAAVGLAAGLLGAFVFGPLFEMLINGVAPKETAASVLGVIKELKFTPMHGSVWGLVFNIPLFVIVSMMTKKVPAERVAEFAAVAEGRKKAV